MSAFKPKHILVTGGAGFIGANYVHYLLRSDQAVRVVNLDAFTYAGRHENLEDLPVPSRHTLIKGDITDADLVTQLLQEHNIDCVVHFAAESHVDRSISGPAAFIQTNLVGTFTLLEACRQKWLNENSWTDSNCRFHHISTDEVYGSLEANDAAFTESTLYAPNSPYSASKAGSDHLVRAYFHTYGLPVTTSNCSNNYGPRQHPEKFVPTVIRSCLQGKPIPIYGDGKNVRDWLYVDDHCSGIDAVVRRGELAQTYNIGGNNEWTNIDVVKAICTLMDEKHPDGAPHEQLISFVTDRAGHDRRYAIDNSKITAELDWSPAETFPTGLEKTVNWYLKHGA